MSTNKSNHFFLALPTPLGTFHADIACLGRANILYDQTDVFPSLAEGKYERCVLLKWQIHTLEDALDLTAKFSLLPEQNIQSGPASGQYLEAVTCTSNDYELTIGMRNEDEEDISDQISYIENGLKLTFPSLPPLETFDFCVAVAWHVNIPVNDSASWIAVDCSLP